jgi:fumarylacetoacetase
VVTLDELRRVNGPAQEPPPLDYLRCAPFAYDIALEVELNGTLVSRTNSRQLYWNVAQQIAHLTSNGAALRAGDLLASGTISGAGEREQGSLIELSWNGERPLELDDGSERTFLQDGDVVVLRGQGLGEVRGRVVP